VRGAVLAGGGSSRFGHRPKGLETIGGRRLFDRVVDVVHDATGTLPLLVANDPDAADWNPALSVVPDLVPGAGSLGGIYTAVRATSDAVLIVAWDMPLLSAELLRALIEGSAAYDVFLPESLLHNTGFHDAVHVGRMPLAEVARHGVPAELFFNVNAAEDLDAARALWRVRRGE